MSRKDSIAEGRWRGGQGRTRRPAVLALPVLALAVVASVVLAGCGRGSPSPSAERLKVVTTTTVFADMIENVGGDAVTVTSLVPKNGDVHTFGPKPADMRAVAEARLIVVNGLGLDDWVTKTIANAAEPGTPVLTLAKALPGVDLLPGDAPRTQNPHLWMDVAYAKLYVDRIADALSSADPAHAATFSTGARIYKERLAKLDEMIRSRIAAVPSSARKVVMFHDAFAYFARAYGIEIVGVAVEAPGQEPRAGYTADLIAAIRTSGAKAIFSEAQFPTKIVDQLGAETGVTVVANLFDDALGDAPVTSYESLMTWDADRIVEALK